MAEFAIGVDSGGTFTDLVLLNRESGQRAVHKLPTTPDDPAVCSCAGVQSMRLSDDSST